MPSHPPVQHVVLSRHADRAHFEFDLERPWRIRFCRHRDEWERGEGSRGNLIPPSSPIFTTPIQNSSSEETRVRGCMTRQSQASENIQVSPFWGMAAWRGWGVDHPPRTNVLMPCPVDIVRAPGSVCETVQTEPASSIGGLWGSKPSRS